MKGKGEKDSIRFSQVVFRTDWTRVVFGVAVAQALFSAILCSPNLLPAGLAAETRTDSVPEHALRSFASTFDYLALRFRTTTGEDWQRQAVAASKTDDYMAASKFLLAAAEPLGCGRLDEAKALIDEAVECTSRLPVDKQKDFARFLCDLPNRLGRIRGPISPQVSQYLINTGLTLTKNLPGGAQEDAVPFMVALASSYRSERRYVEAEGMLKQAISLARGKNSSYYMSASSALEGLYQLQGKKTEAEKLLQNMQSDSAISFGSGSRERANALEQQIRFLLSEKRAREAVPLAETYLAADASSNSRARDLERMAKSFAEAGENQVADRLYKAAVDPTDVRRVSGTDISIIDGYCAFLVKQGHGVQAVDVVKKKLDEQENSLGRFKGNTYVQLELNRLRSLYEKYLRATNRLNEAQAVREQIEGVVQTHHRESRHTEEAQLTSPERSSSDRIRNATSLARRYIRDNETSKAFLCTSSYRRVYRKHQKRLRL